MAKRMFIDFLILLLFGLMKLNFKTLVNLKLTIKEKIKFEIKKIAPIFRVEKQTLSLLYIAFYSK
jgi:hypothetical protein